jgi:hypothetical protein
MLMLRIVAVAMMPSTRSSGLNMISIEQSFNPFFCTR